MPASGSQVSVTPLGAGPGMLGAFKVCTVMDSWSTVPAPLPGGVSSDAETGDAAVSAAQASRVIVNILMDMGFPMSVRWEVKDGSGLGVPLVVAGILSPAPIPGMSIARKISRELADRANFKHKIYLSWDRVLRVMS
ncbi:hypothetical protein Ssi02_51670 [Sinosporangium siamense]|uniref:Uncharacterized protein n=1 Tax=Sinosporangium siamense TaxID=1367973 RepID=A0A919V950_9ACTN|nr:hypothetical protein Ssi02_51670 [Sinosporangium siamense]